jgi:hypothetical protein
MNRKGGLFILHFYRSKGVCKPLEQKWSVRCSVAEVNNSRNISFDKKMGIVARALGYTSTFSDVFVKLYFDGKRAKAALGNHQLSSRFGATPWHLRPPRMIARG